MDGQWDSAKQGAWTAVSRAPYLKALDMYGKGDCWEGGGVFLSNQSYAVNDRYFARDTVLYLNSGLQHDESYRPERKYGAECASVYYPRLIRDGWTLIQRHRHSQQHAVSVFERPAPDGWTLRKTAHEQVSPPAGKGCYWDEHHLIDPSGQVEDRPDWQWAELDGSSLVWAEHGCLYRAISIGESMRESSNDATLLRDFNADVYSVVDAPY